MIEIGHASHTGMRREFNEDSYWADSQRGLYLVVDGMGGHGRGEVAAAIARDALVAAAHQRQPFAAGLRDAGTAIAAYASSTPGAAPMGVALALLGIDGARFEAMRIGDARAYLWQHGNLTRLCVGDPAEAPSEDAPAGEDAAAPLTRHRNRITQALGITPAAELYPGTMHGRFARGTQILLCTDGLCDELDATGIAAILARTDLAAQECVDHLLLTALDAGGHDNISIVLVRAT